MIDFSRHDTAVGRRPDHDAAAGEALTDIVVGVALELEGDAAGEPGAEALARGAGEPQMDGAVGESSMAVALGHFARQHAADGAAAETWEPKKACHSVNRPSRRSRVSRCRDCVFSSS